ncbi:DNA repair protein, putative, partial [Bodo saltans]
MGVHNLWRLLDLFAHNTTAEEWAGTCVAVDASVWIQQFRSAFSARGSRFGRQRPASGGHDYDGGDNEDGTTQKLLEGFLNRTLKLLYYGITPIFVFDGPSSQLKSREVQRRRESRRQLELRQVARQARRILRAQVTLGLIPACDVESLPPVTRVVAPATVSPQYRHPSPKKAASSPSRRFRAKRAMQRRRNGGATVVLIAPEGVSKQSTSDFLSKSKSFLAEKSQGDATNASNLLLLRSRSSVSSGGSSMYLGPREVLERRGKSDVDISDDIYDDVSRENEDDDEEARAAMKPSHVSQWMNEAGCDDDDAPRCLVEQQRQCAPSSEFEGTSNWFLTQAEIDDEEGGNESQRASSQYLSSVRSSTTLKSVATSTSASRQTASVSSCPSSPASSSSSVLSDDSVEFVGASHPLGGAATGVTPPAFNNVDAFESVYNKEVAATTRCVISSFEVVVDESSNSVVECSAPIVPPPPPPAPFSDEVGNRVVIGNNSGVVCHVTATQRNQRRSVGVVAPCGLVAYVESAVRHQPRADAQCAYLCQSGVVDAVFTEDSDVVVHGASVVLRGFFTKPVMTGVRQRELHEQGITKAVLLSLTELLGCDYTEGMRMNVADALEVIGCCMTNSAHVTPFVNSDTTSITEAVDTLRRWKTIAMASFHRFHNNTTTPTSLIPSRPTNIISQLEASFQRLLDEELSILQRSVVMPRFRAGQWNAWGSALLDELFQENVHSSSFPQEDVLRMFTEEVPVDMKRIASRPSFPDINWEELRRFIRSINLDHMWDRLGTTQRAVEKIQEQERQRLHDQMQARQGHRDITSFLTNGSQRKHFIANGPTTQAQTATRGDSLSSGNGSRATGR